MQGNGVIEITRTYEGIKFLDSTLPKDIENKILSDYLPLGDPSENFMYVFPIDGASCYQFFNGTAERSLIGVVIMPRDNLDQSILFYPETKSINEQIQAQKQNDLLGKPNLDVLTNLNQLEGLIYAFFTGKPTIFIGSEPKIREIIIALCSITPKNVVKHLSFITNATQPTKSVKCHGVDPKYVTNFEISESETVVNLLDNQIISMYDCDITIKLTQLLKDEKNEALNAEISDLSEKITQVKDSSSPLDVAESLRCSMADAEFIWEINQNQ